MAVKIIKAIFAFITGFIISYFLYVFYGLFMKYIGLIEFSYKETISLTYKIVWGSGFVLYFFYLSLIYYFGKKSPARYQYYWYIIGAGFPYVIVLFVVVTNYLFLN
jgi:hypothetical protein